MDTNRFSQLSFKNGKVLTNRVVVPPMASETATIEGFVTEETLNHYRRLTTAGTGLVMVEYSHVHPSGRSDLHQLGIYADSQIEGLSKIAAIIKGEGRLAGIQITHAGGKSTRDFTGGPLMTPSHIPVPVKDEIMEAGTPMNKKEITLWIKSFRDAALRAEKAGFDIVELHAAHGYGLNQWLSPLTNQRDDEYGGSLQGRVKMLLEIIHAIKTACPDLLLAIRMPGQDFLEGGLSTEDTSELAQIFEASGVDILDVSSGIGGWRRPRDRRGQGYLTNEASKIQSVVSLPVIGVGGIETGEFIDLGISQKLFSLAAVGRAILSSPADWYQENLSTFKEGVCLE